MNNAKKYFLITFMFCLLGAFAPQKSFAATQKVYGYVKDAKTQKAIYQAKVQLKQDSTVVSTQNTSLSGYYSISTSKTGQFVLDISKSGYSNYSKSFTLTTRQAISLDCLLTPVLLDTTAPSKPAVTDAGAYTNSFVELSASWSSSDPESGITEYQYCINTSSTPVEPISWTSAGTKTSIITTGLSLTGGQTYYFHVKAKNGVGLWSAIGSSDGIKVNRPPTINSLLPATGAMSEEGDNVALSVQASDPDTDPLEYQFSINSIVTRPWSSSSGYSWTISAGAMGSKNIKAEVRDNKGAVSQAGSEIYIFRKPIQL